MPWLLRNWNNLVFSNHTVVVSALVTLRLSEGYVHLITFCFRRRHLTTIRDDRTWTSSPTSDTQSVPLSAALPVALTYCRPSPLTVCHRVHANGRWVRWGLMVLWRISKSAISYPDASHLVCISPDFRETLLIRVVINPISKECFASVDTNMRRGLT